MPIQPGARLGSYSVISKIGEGGMGQVFKARDSRLNRDVAIKVLPELFATDGDRLARFTREAQALAALNHANIAQIYGIEDSDAGKALVMELVEGDDLSALIARAPRGLALDDALPIARQIADALEAAHEQGLVHRDLKPQNIKVKTDGSVKVLDFGLAKAVAPDGPTASADLANSPTLTARATQMGMIIGTAAYMAPEQAKGRAVDKRADVWAFGAVLYEMLTGRRAFEGDDITEVLASVLKTDPDWSAIPATTPASVRRLLRRCLERDVKKRLSAIGDARLDLDERGDDGVTQTLTMPAATTSGVTMPAPMSAAPARGSVHKWIWAVAGVVIILGGVLITRLWPDAAAPAGTGAAGVTRTSINGPAEDVIYADSCMVSLSPDGGAVAFVSGVVTRSDLYLWVRPLNALAPRKLEGTSGAQIPFWSPDGTRLGFFTNSQLKTVPYAGGPVEVVADAPNARGGAWSPRNVIVFAPDAMGPLMRVSPNGGTPVVATSLDAAKKERGHRFPAFLPDGDHFTYAVVPGRGGKFPVFVGSLSSPGQRVSLGDFDTAPVYAAPGYLVYTHSGVLTAVPFDAKSLKITGDPVSLPDQPTTVLDPKVSWTAAPLVSVGRTDAIAYYSAPSPNARLEWFAATGQSLGALHVPPGPIDWARLSPDGAEAALVRSNSPSDSTIWIADLARGSVAPITTGHGRNDDPVWSPDGKQMVFASDRDGAQDFFLKTLADATPEHVIFRSDALFKSPSDWSPDGKTLLIGQLDQDSAQNIYALPVGGGTLAPEVRGPLRDIGGRFSPDGKWMLYISDESGQFQLMAQSVPPSGTPIRISQSGAAAGFFSRDGRSIVYPSPYFDALWRVDITLGTTLRVGAARKIATLPAGITGLDATRDLDKFLAVIPDRSGAGSITLVQGWRNALKK